VTEEIKRKARKGDSRAQYALSETEFEDGNKTEALKWLKKSVQKDFPDACFTMATFQMAGISVPYDAVGARTNLARASDQGHADAQLLFSQLVRSGYGGEKNTRLANDLLLDLAKKGHPLALCGVAMLLHIRRALGDAVDQLLELAALKGSHIAAYIQAHERRDAALGGDLIARNDRIKFLFIAADAGNRLATAELVEYKKQLVAEVLKAASFSSTIALDFDFESIEEIINKDVEHNLSQPEILSDGNNILIYRAFLTPLECIYIKAAAAPTIQPSSTIHPLTGKLVKNFIRTSSSSNFDPVSRDCFIYAVDERIAAASGTNTDQGEALNILYYRVGEEYKYHYDHLPDGGKQDMTFLQESGQRKYTFVISMNEGYVGGETVFPDLDLKYRGRLGDALMFQNLHDDGTANKLMRHAGMPLSKGTKWVATKWIREKKFSFGTPSVIQTQFDSM
jgi:hypothetical protein